MLASRGFLLFYCVYAFFPSELNIFSLHENQFIFSRASKSYITSKGVFPEFNFNRHRKSDVWPEHWEIITHRVDGVSNLLLSEEELKGGTTLTNLDSRH